MKDFNDLGAIGGRAAVERCLQAAAIPDPPQRDAVLQKSGKSPAIVELVCGSDIEPEPIDWLWLEHLAKGKVHILGGKPAAGKTTLALQFAATITTGGHWPDKSKCAAGNVVIWSGEDDPKDTLVPRLIAAGADMARVHFITGVREDGESRPFDPAGDVPRLAAKLDELRDVALLMVDPVVSAVAGDGNKNNEVRRALQPLADLAARSGCCVLGITHFTKGTGGRDPVERITGSLAYGAVARIVLVAAKKEEDGDDGETGRVMMRAKSNIGPDGSGFEYDLKQVELADYPGIVASVVTWGKAVTGSAREILADAEANGDDAEGGSVADAEDWLKTRLANGPAPARTIKTESKSAGHSWSTVRRAQKALGIEPKKSSKDGPWLWSLPPRCSEDAQGAQRNLLGTFGIN